MDWTAKPDLFNLLLKLMPGFLAAWVFLGLQHIKGVKRSSV